MSSITSLDPLIHKTDILLAIYLGAVVSAELLGSKIFSILGVNASVAIFIFPLTYTINDIITEVHGKQRAISFVKAGLYVLVGLFLYTLLAVNLPAAERFSDQEAYATIFQKSQRIILASLIAYWVSERLDVLVFTKIKQKLGNKALWFRNNTSNIASQLLDTTIFMFLAFYTPGKFGFMISLIIPYWLLKCSASSLFTPLTYAGIKWLKSK